MPLTRFLRRTVDAGLRRTRRWRRSPADQLIAARAHRALLQFDPWCLDVLRVEGDRVTISGWALAPQGNHSVVSFALNGEPFEMVEYPTDRPDLGALYWYLPYARHSGYRCSTRADPAALISGGPLAVQCIDRRTGKPFRDDHGYYFDPRSSLGLPIPDGERMRRVHGNESRESFLLEGYSAYAKLDQALTRYAGKRLADDLRVLDWGCGCGRLIRHLSALNSHVTGCDIDADNVNWCRQHLPGATYFDVPLHPPTSLPSSAFDVIVGISVMTHLKEQDQLDWLGELRRVAAPGAVLLLTVHGNATAARGTWDVPEMRDWQQRGIVDGGNSDLDGFIPERDYYRNTIQTPDYVRRHWGRFFEVVTIVESYIGNVQDLVVLRAREDR